MTKRIQQVKQMFIELMRDDGIKAYRDLAWHLAVSLEVCELLGRIADALEARGAPPDEEEREAIRAEDLEGCRGPFNTESATQRRQAAILNDFIAEKRSRETGRGALGLGSQSEDKERLEILAAEKDMQYKRDSGLWAEFSSLPDSLYVWPERGIEELKTWADRLSRSPVLFDHLLAEVSRISTERKREGGVS